MDTVWSLPVAANWLWGHLYVSVLPIFSTNRETWMERMRWKGFTNKTNNRRAKSKVTAEAHILMWNQGSSSQHSNNLPDMNHRCWSDTHVGSYIHTQMCRLHCLGVTGLGRSPQITADSQQAVGKQHITNWACKKNGHHSGLAVSKPAMGKASQVQPLPLLFILVSWISPDFKDFW